MVANPIRQFYSARSRQWQTTDAEVESCAWKEGLSNVGTVTGHYDVAFTYQPDPAGNVRRGSFCYLGSPQVAPYRPGEKVPIYYNPKKPWAYSYSGDNSGPEKLEAIVVTILFAAIAGYLLYAF